MIYETIGGKVTFSSLEYVVLETGGIGYKIFVPLNLSTKGLKLGESITLFISHVVREDSQKLFGFSTREERNFFEKLCTISGVGPKTALAMIGHMENSQLKSAIQMGNASLLSKIPGIGKKTAERIIVDLGDTMHKWRLEQSAQGESISSDVALDALQTLINLGYNRAQAQKAVTKVLETTEGKDPPLSNVIALSLKNI